VLLHGSLALYEYEADPADDPADDPEDEPDDDPDDEPDVAAIYTEAFELNVAQFTLS
jgi:hypothetical protein